MAFQYSIAWIFSSMYEYRLPQFVSDLYLWLSLIKALYVAFREGLEEFLTRADLINVSSCVGLSKPQAMKMNILNRRLACLHPFKLNRSWSQLRKVLNLGKNRVMFKAFTTLPWLTSFSAIFEIKCSIQSLGFMLCTRGVLTENRAQDLVRRMFSE